MSGKDSRLFQCACDGGAQAKPIDPFAYDLAGYRVGANAIRLHDQVVKLLVVSVSEAV